MPRMTSNQKEQHLSKVSKMPKTAIGHVGYGAWLVAETGKSFSELIEYAVVDRLKLAGKILRTAQAAKRNISPSSRLVISRSYYAMYHALRSVCFYSNQGDDYEAHAKLPQGIPNDFPSKSYWENEIKNARLERNSADYEPYPKDERKLDQKADERLKTANKLLSTVRIYLRSKGFSL